MPRAVRHAAPEGAGGLAGTAVVLLVGVQTGASARRVRRERREPPQQAPHARDSRLALERDGQVRGARSARVERISPLANRPTTPRRSLCAHPRWRARPPSCRTLVWKNAGMCREVSLKKPLLKIPSEFRARACAADRICSNPVIQPHSVIGPKRI